jgi:hypothetical protein
MTRQAFPPVINQSLHTYVFPFPDLPWVIHIALWDFLYHKFSLNIQQCVPSSARTLKDAIYIPQLRITSQGLAGAMWGVSSYFEFCRLNLNINK